MNNEKLLKFIESINNFDYSDFSRNTLKNYLCYFMEQNELLNSDFINQLIYIASEKLKNFGYEKMAHLSNIECSDKEFVVSKAIKNYHKANISFGTNTIVLDGFQKEIIDKYQSLDNKRIIISAPTSFGKTYILQEIICINKNTYNNIMLILPTIALLNETYSKITNLNNNLNLKYKIITTNYEETSERNIFIFTPERALKFIGLNKITLDFFFFDELYKIDESLQLPEDLSDNQSGVATSIDKRAIAFRTCLYLLSKTVKDFYLAGPFISFNSLRGTGFDEFIKKYNITIFSINFDPTLRITYSAWKKSGIEEENPVTNSIKSIDYKIDKITRVEKFKRVESFILNNNLGKTIFYLQNPNEIVKLIKDVDNEYIENYEMSETLKIFVEHLKNKYNVKKYGIETSDYWSIINCLKHGIGIHHGQIPKYIQTQILDEFNKKDTGLKYLFCTSTIIEGVNTSAKNVVMVANSIGKDEQKIFSQKNIKGRAGRYYINPVGRVFFLNKEQKDIDIDFKLKLNFLNYSINSLTAIDLDNTDIEDLSENNKIAKNNREQQYNKELLPDDIFIQNRLFDKLQQEKILNILIKDEKKFNILYDLVIRTINKDFPFSSLLKIIIKYELPVFQEKRLNSYEIDKKTEIYEKIETRLLTIIERYQQNKFISLLDYQIWRMREKDNYNDEQIKDKIDEKYNVVFSQIRNIIEYDIPRYINLFQSLFFRACQIKNKKFENSGLEEFIQEFEIGKKSNFNQLLSQNGIPNITTEVLEQYLLNLKVDLNDTEMCLDTIKQNFEQIHDIDAYERYLISKNLFDN